MGLFTYLMKFGMSKEENYIDVSDKIAVSFPKDIYSVIVIKSNFSLRFSKGTDFVNCQTFLKNEADADKVTVQYAVDGVDNTKLIIDIFTSSKNMKGYINIELPTCERLEVTNIYEDIHVQNVDIINLVLCTNTGDITVSSAKFVSGTITTDSGDILVILDKNEYHIKAKSDFGDVIKNVKNIPTSKKTLICRSKSGDIQFKLKHL